MVHCCSHRPSALQANLPETTERHPLSVVESKLDSLLCSDRGLDLLKSNYTNKKPCTQQNWTFMVHLSSVQNLIAAARLGVIRDRGYHHARAKRSLKDQLVKIVHQTGRKILTSTLAHCIAAHLGWRRSCMAERCIALHGPRYP